MIISMSTPTSEQKIIKIMPLGDSITCGDSNLGYRGPLYDMLATAGYKFIPVGNFGRIVNGQGGVPQMGGAIGGPWVEDTGGNGEGYKGPFPIDFEGHGGFQAGRPAEEIGYTDHMLAQMVPVDIPRFQPDIILMHLGTNDLYGGWTKHGGWSEIDSADNVLGVIDQIHNINPNIWILVSEIGKGRGRDSLIRVSDMIKDGVQARILQGRKIEFIDDMYDNFTEADMADFVHPNAKGYTKMAEVWYRHLKKYLDGNM
ncbi:MAG: hypothetical protein K6U74_00855 [Firmicutes bacterium]|nr:hypothetical protein [Bacillota bacterium]